MNWLKVILFLVIGLLFSKIEAQVTHASISQHEIMIGERVTLSYSLPIDQDGNVKFEAGKKFLPVQQQTKDGKLKNAPSETVEIMTPFRDTILDTEGSPVWTGYYEITVWDSGTYVLPGPTIEYNGEELQFPGVQFEGKFSAQRQGIDIYDIEESFSKLPESSFKDKLMSFLSSYGWIFLLLLTGIFIWRWYRRKKLKAIPPQTTLSLHEQTLKGLEALGAQQLWKSGKIKEHYFHLSFLIRNYLGGAFELQLLERTTNETIFILQSRISSKELFLELKRFLEIADLVKFAKHQPDERQIMEDLELCRSIINEVNRQLITSDE